ncbi:MAG: extracellular solute-binding protein [Microbacteriaceae bacterium]
MKRTLTKALAPVAIIGLAVSLAGCTSAAPTDEASGPLTVWVMGDSGANFEQLVAPYVKESGQKVEVVAIPWDSIDEKLTTAVASGKGPDLIQVGLSKLRTFADAGALLPLQDELGDHPGLDPANFPAGVASSVGGDQVSVPWVADTRVLFYRTDILSDAGIDAPPTTWEQLRTDAKTLASRGKGQYGYYIPQWDSPLPLEMAWSFGGQVVDKDGNIDFDTAEFNDALDVYLGLYSDGSVPVNGDFDQTQGFISGITPMLMSGPYLASGIMKSAPELEGKWDVTTIPSGGDGDPTSLFAGSNMGVWFNTDQKSASLDLLEYLSSAESQLSWYSLNGELPALSKALADPSLTADPLVSVYTKQLASSNSLPLVANWDGGTGADLMAALNAIALTGADRDSTMQKFFDATAGTSTN